MNNLKYCLLAVLVLVSVHVAFAHETVSAGATTLFVHIEPNDAPVAGEPATLFPNLTSKEKGFAVKDCNCVITISQNEKVLLEEKLTPSDEPDAFGITPVPFIFPANGTYDITVSGAPITVDTFTFFEADYDLVVGGKNEGESHDHSALSHSASDHPHREHTLHFILFGGVIVASVGIMISEKRKQK